MDATTALKILDALQREAFSLGAGEPESLRPYKLGCTIEQLEAWIDDLNDNIQYSMDGPHQISDAGATLAEELTQTVLQHWRLTPRGWVYAGP